MARRVIAIERDRRLPALAGHCRQFIRTAFDVIEATRSRSMPRETRRGRRASVANPATTWRRPADQVMAGGGGAFASLTDVSEGSRRPAGAKPRSKDHGRLSVFVQGREVKRLFDIPPAPRLHPPPGVTSTVVDWCRAAPAFPAIGADLNRLPPPPSASATRCFASR